MKKILLLGSIVSPCPPKKQGGTERVAYIQGKYLVKNNLPLIFIGAKETKKNFIEQLKFEKEKEISKIIKNIEFIEIGGGTGFGNQEDSIEIDPRLTEASRKLRLEIFNLAKVQEIMIEKKEEYEIILNNIRGEAFILPLAKLLKKKVINVLHLNLFDDLACFFKKYQTKLIAIANHQKEKYPNLNFIATIYNPVNTTLFLFKKKPKNYALMISTIGHHKNQKDAILACRKANIPLILSGKIRDQEYFDKEIKPYIDNKKLIYYGEIDFEKKLKLYQEAKVFLFPILWQEPFGLVCIEALSCGTPVIAYPNGGPKEIIKDGFNGFLVKNYQQMSEKIKEIEKISRHFCRQDTVKRFDEELIGKKYYEIIIKETE